MSKSMKVKVPQRLVSDGGALWNQENVCYLRAAKNIPVWNEIKSETRERTELPAAQKIHQQCLCKQNAGWSRTEIEIKAAINKQ